MKLVQVDKDREAWEVAGRGGRDLDTDACDVRTVDSY